MKYPLLILITFFALYGLSARHSESENDLFLDEIADPACSIYYEFDDSIINLYSLKTVQYQKGEFPLFKECWYYKYRFEGDQFGFVLKSDSILNDRYCSYTFVNPSKVKVKDPDYEVNYYDLPHEMFQNGMEIQPYTLAHPSGIILIYEFPDSAYYHIYRMKYNGELTGHLRIRHTEIAESIEKGVTSYHYERYLYPNDYRQDYLVFSGTGHWNDIRKTVVVNLANMEQKEYDFNLSGVIWDDFEREIKGFTLAPEKHAYSDTSNLMVFWKSDSSYWKMEIPYASEKCQTILWGTHLFVANYHSISTGSSLHCFDTYARKKIWTADVLQMNVDHSKYYNKVMLSKYRDRLIMEGNEAQGNYLQIFEMNTGKRLAEFGDVVIKK